MSKQIEQAINSWLKEVVIGLNLCPFAARPYFEQRYKIIISNAKNETIVLEELFNACSELESTNPEKLETTLLVVPGLWPDFLDFNEFLDLVDALLENNHWTGIYQVASFHPKYQFEGTQVDDDENLTNRSPYPILHILRETSVSNAVDSLEEPAEIPATNIHKMQALTHLQKRQYFHYLYPEEE